MKTVLIVDAGPGSSGREDLLPSGVFREIRAQDMLTALDIVRKGPPIDLLMTELQLPDNDGLKLIAAVRVIDPRIPIIVVTRSRSIENYLHAMSLGVYEYISKPVRPEVLVRIARIALSGPWGSPPVPTTT